MNIFLINIMEFEKKLAISSKRNLIVDLYIKITHMWRRWGTTQNFFLAFTDELEKQIFTKETLEVGQ